MRCMLADNEIKYSYQHLKNQFTVKLCARKGPDTLSIRRPAAAASSPAGGEGVGGSAMAASTSTGGSAAAAPSGAPGLAPPQRRYSLSRELLRKPSQKPACFASSLEKTKKNTYYAILMELRYVWF